MSQLTELSGLSAILNEVEAQQLLSEIEMKPLLNDYYQQPDPLFVESVPQDDGLNQLAMIAYGNHLSNEPHLSIPPSVISNEEYAGPLNFEVFISPTSKTSWVYSASLRKIFIAMNSLFPIDFKTDPTDIPLFVRATPLFCLPQHSQELVVRCIPHAQKTDSTNINKAPHIWDHVIRCENPAASYEGNKNENIHLSVVVPLGKPQTGTDTVREMYQFVCKNSCPSGMNRKPLEIVFTLENKAREILGRSILKVRVCSCPKRDKEKEEKEVPKNGVTEPPHGKKRKIDKSDKKPSNVDLREFTLNVKIIGKQNYLDILNGCIDKMSGQIIRHGCEQPFKKCIEEIQNVIKNHTD